MYRSTNGSYRSTDGSVSFSWRLCINPSTAPNLFFCWSCTTLPTALYCYHGGSVSFYRQFPYRSSDGLVSFYRQLRSTLLTALYRSSGILVSFNRCLCIVLQTIPFHSIDGPVSFYRQLRFTFLTALYHSTDNSVPLY